ncbi:nucleoside 2-deoxyribosyltransferase [Peptoniphilus sp.]|jgi:nucleoside 2-deoxyribosyltransferase|uniref:nucleoside 2-deoxyribosyltransferase n=1 Tax=Peptoniphilus sp. TaxID=1971214 RepID=UPI003D8C6804
MKLYLAGALFNEAEVNQRKLEGEILRKRFPQLEIYNPIDEPFNENKESLPTPEEIYEGDKKAVEDCDIFICDLSKEDSGVAAELGMALYTDTKIIIGINSDIRLTSSNKYDVPTVGMNHFVLGAILTNGELAKSFEEACDILEKKLEEM